MSRLRPTRPKEVARVLEKLGFEQRRQSGSHAVFKHPNGTWTTVPFHLGRDIAKGTLRKIIKDAGLSTEEFNRLL